MIDVANIKNEKLKKICDNLEEKFFFLKNTINLPNYWNPENAFEIEIKKSFIRGILRYSSNTKKIIQFIQSQIQIHKIKNVNYATSIYPMVHLINDKVEGGDFHYDDEKNKNFYTLWFPITDNHYSPISILRYQNKFIDNFAKIIIKFKLSNIYSKKLYASKGNFFLWNGKRIHAGNINQSKFISCACQLKISERMYKFEDSFNLNLSPENTFEEVEQKDILGEFNLYNKFLKSLYENSNQKNELIINFLKNSGKIKRHFSFSLSLLSQRILSKKKYFSKVDENFTKSLDELSLLIGSENLISLNRLLKYFNGDKIKLLNNLEKKDVLNVLGKLDLFKV